MGFSAGEARPDTPHRNGGLAPSEVSRIRCVAQTFRKKAKGSPYPSRPRFNARRVDAAHFCTLYARGTGRRSKLKKTARSPCSFRDGRKESKRRLPPVGYDARM